MLGLKVRYPESKGDWCERSNRRLKQIRGRLHRRRWSEQYWSHVFAWAGHVARMNSYDPHRLPYHVLKLKDLEWLGRRKRAYGSQLHCFGRLKVWRWETILTSQLGTRWFEIAQDKTVWHSCLDSFASNRKHFR